MDFYIMEIKRLKIIILFILINVLMSINLIKEGGRSLNYRPN